MTTKEWLRPHQVAQAAGVHTETLRYYERRGLIDSPPRSPGGHRAYRGEVVDLVKMIKSAQALGFTLAEVAELLEFSHRPSSAKGGLQARAQQKLTEVDAKIDELTAIRGHLLEAIRHGCEDVSVCLEHGCCLPQDVTTKTPTDLTLGRRA